MAQFEHNSAKFGYLNLDDLDAVQKGLNALGFDAGKADGKDGPNTQKAIREFQAHALVQVDGKLGPITRGALSSELDKRAADETPAA